MVLCLAMMLSIMVVGAGAAFADQDQIDSKHQEAVDACVALNIINGIDQDGKTIFKPNGEVTREQMAKMICVLLNGGKEPVLGSGNSSFSDVAADRWSAPYIASCVKQGIVAGVGGGKFNPQGNVTGTQAAKMLLVALGYSQDIQEYTGADWAVNVNVDASAKGFYTDLEDIDPNAALSREHAAEMIWNALNAYEVEYKNALVTDPVTGQLTSQNTAQDKASTADPTQKVTLLEDKYESTTRTGILTSVNLDSDDNTYTTRVVGDLAIPVFDASKDYSEFIGQSVKVMYKRDAKTGDATLLGLYPTSDNKTVSCVYGDAKISGNTAKIDGTDYDITGITTIATNGTVINSADYGNWANYPYAEVTLVDNDKDKVYEYAVVNPFHVAQLDSLTAKKAYFVDSVDFGSGQANYSMDLEDLDSYDNMAEDDYVYLTEAAYTVSGNWAAVKAETVSGTATGVKGTTPSQSALIEGTWYETAPGAYAADNTIVPKSGDKLDYAVVCNGYMFATEGASGSADKLALVLRVGDQDFDGDFYQVKLLFNDSSKSVTKAYVKDGSTKSAPELGVLYTYSTASDGYVLKEIKAPADIDMKTQAGTNVGNNSTGWATYSSITNKVGSNRVNADAQVFVLFDADNADVTKVTSYDGKVITGADADKWSDNTYNLPVAYSNSDSRVAVMVANIGNADAPNASDDAKYGVIVSTPYTSTDSEDKDIYVIDLLTADGIQTGIQVADSEFDSSFAKNQLVSYAMDGEKYVDFTAAPSETTAIAAGAVTDVNGKIITVLKADGSSIELKLDDDSMVLYFDSTEGTAASGSFKKATKQDATHYYANVMVVYKTTVESDGTYLIKGAAVEVPNQLQDKSDNDILITIP